MDETQNANLKHFKEIYIDTAPKLIYYAYRYVDSSTAEDIVQDVFLKIWHKNSYLFMQSDIKAYLFRSVQNACWDYLKHQDVKGDYLKSTMKIGRAHV